jgi:hypothetical protein
MSYRRRVVSLSNQSRYPVAEINLKTGWQATTLSLRGPPFACRRRSLDKIFYPNKAFRLPLRQAGRNDNTPSIHQFRTGIIT